MALSEGDIDEAFIASARALVVTGTHFSTPSVAAASRKAMKIARRHRRKVILDIDYRPVLWGLTGLGLGENRFVDSADVTATLRAILRGLRRHRRHRGGDPYRRRQHRYADCAGPPARGEPRRHRAEARC